ncbi:MAG: DUF2092 domain-containing protein [Pseudobdellovibrionaceae bacterium]
MQTLNPIANHIWLRRFLLVLILSLPLPLEMIFAQEKSPDTKPAMDPVAERLLKNMSDYLAKLPAFSFRAGHSLEVVTDSGQKLSFESESQVSVQRPNKVRSDRKGLLADLTLFYDGKNLTLYGKETKYYATTKTPATLDQTMDLAREKLNLEIPGSDLLYSNPYQILKEDVVSSMYLGKTRIQGLMVHHLAFRGTETDWQIWIADGPKPRPVKFMIVTKKLAQAPSASVEIQNWNPSPKFSPEFFTFKPSPDDMRISFAKDIQNKQSLEKR